MKSQEEGQEDQTEVKELGGILPSSFTSPWSSWPSYLGLPGTLSRDLLLRESGLGPLAPSLAGGGKGGGRAAPSGPRGPRDHHPFEGTCRWGGSDLSSFNESAGLRGYFTLVFKVLGCISLKYFEEILPHLKGR